LIITGKVTPQLYF